MRHTIVITLWVFSSWVLLSAQDIPRTSIGHPDLSGTYDTATLTPLERPEIFGDRLTLSEEEAATIAAHNSEQALTPAADAVGG